MLAAAADSPPVDAKEGVAVSTPLVMAVADYDIPGKSFLPLRANDVVLVLEADASGWWLGMNAAGRKGVLPSTYTVPYVFPTPSAETVLELELLRLADEYGVDLTSGAPSLPLGTSLMKGPAVPPKEVQAIRTAEDLYRVSDAAIVSREARRADLTSSLKSLQRIRRSVREASESPTNPSAVQQLRQVESERSSLPSSLDALVRALVVARTEACAFRTNTVQGDRMAPVSQEECRAAVKGGTPSHSWYAKARVVLDGATAIDAAVVDTFSVAAELRDVKNAVRWWEEVLTTLSQDTKAAELGYRREKDVLQRRIERRDQVVTRMLAWWAEQAAEARSEYLATKARWLRQAEVGEREVSEMQHTLEEKRHSFSVLAEELEEARVAAKEIRRLLQRRPELNDLEASIQAVNQQIARTRQAKA